jgi:hypothetical protein
MQLPLGCEVRLKSSKAVLLYLLATAVFAHERVLVPARRLPGAPAQYEVPVAGTLLPPEARFRIN